jgi:hypothetical protein
VPRGLTGVGRTADPAETSRRTAWLVLLGVLWLVTAAAAVHGALTSDWPPIPELPTAEQVRNARANALSAAAVAVLPPVLGVVLARRWRNDLATVLFLVGAMAAVLLSGLLVALTNSPVR